MSVEPRQEAKAVDWVYRRRILASTSDHEEHGGFLALREALLQALTALFEETLAEEELGRLYSRPGHSTDEEIIDADERVSHAYEQRRQATWALSALRGEE